MTISENDFIKIDFEFGTEPHIFRDAIHLPADHTLSDAEIEAIKQSRYDNWVSVAKPLAEETTTDLLLDAGDYVEVDGVRYYKSKE
jgi:hypothetical protein